MRENLPAAILGLPMLLQYARNSSSDFPSNSIRAQPFRSYSLTIGSKSTGPPCLLCRPPTINVTPCKYYIYRLRPACLTRHSPLSPPCVTITFMVSNVRDIQRHVLPNGLIVITETMQHVRSVSVGIWVPQRLSPRSPRRKRPGPFPGAHGLQGHRNAAPPKNIAREMDSVGGMLDAFTSKEQICFNAKVLDEHLPIAFDVLADLVLRPKLDSDDVNKERQVVLEEIKMDLDNPEYLLHDIFTRGFWPEHSLGRLPRHSRNRAQF